MCAAGHRVLFDVDSDKRDLSHAENKLTGERTYFKFRMSSVSAFSMMLTSSSHTRFHTKMQEQNVEELCPFQGQVLWPYVPRTPWVLERVEASWPRRQRTTKCPLIMTLHASPAPTEPEPCPSDRRGKKEKITMPRVMCRTGVGAGHVSLDGSKRRTPDFEIVPERNNGWYRLRVPGRRGDIGQQEAGPSPILVTMSSTTQVTTADVATGPVRQRTGDPQPETPSGCRMPRETGMTVINDDTTECESQDNGLAEMAVREVKGVARTVRVALSELYKKDISSKHPALPWIVSFAAGQISRGQIGGDGETPHQRLKSVPTAASCLCRVRPLPPYWQESKSSPGTLERWIVPRGKRMWNSLTSSWVCLGNQSPETWMRQRYRP